MVAKKQENDHVNFLFVDKIDYELAKTQNRLC
jgi:hypothetical protein